MYDTFPSAWERFPEPEGLTKRAEILRNGLQFGIDNIREHMGVWAAPAEELRDHLLDVQFKIIGAQNLLEAVSEDEDDNPSPLTASLTPLNERVQAFRRDTRSLAAYDFMKLLTIEQQLAAHESSTRPVSDEFGIDFATIADELGVEIEDFYAVCQQEKPGQHLFITPLCENEPYPDMLKRERLYLIHRLRKNILRQQGLSDERLEKDREHAADQLAHHWDGLEAAMNTVSTPKETETIRALVNYSLDHAANYLRAKNDEETLLPLLFPDTSPLDLRPDLHRQRTDKEIELRVARFTKEHRLHSLHTQIGADAVITARRKLAVELKHQAVDIVVGNFVNHVIPELEEHQVQNTLSWLGGLNFTKDGLEEIALFYIESKLHDRLKRTDQSKAMGSIARNLYETFSRKNSRPRVPAQQSDEVAALFHQHVYPAYTSLFPARPVNEPKLAQQANVLDSIVA